jgi:Methyltransferase FkbM domain
MTNLLEPQSAPTTATALPRSFRTRFRAFWMSPRMPRRRPSFVTIIVRMTKGPPMKGYLKYMLNRALMRMPERHAFVLFEALCLRYGVLGKYPDAVATRDYRAFEIFETLCHRYGLIGGIKELPDGATIEGAFRDFGLFVPLMQKGTYSGAADGVLDEYFKSSPHGSYIDIGANIGVTTIPYAIKHDWDFYAFEPDPENFRRLQCNLLRNGLADRVRAYNVALHDKAGTMDLRKSPENSATIV